ncbi:MAG: hypothetical protein IJ593_09445 [Lachnospiraceae bacterium]|nr:hypothetical protein [Lachnospiraceae bacterium]
MSKEELKELINTGHEIEFTYNGKKYSITQGKINGKHVISFCEFYKETTEVDSFSELCDVTRDGITVLTMIMSITMDNIWVY